MADDTDDKTPLLNGIYVSSIQEASLSQRSRTPSSHCHVSDDRFDYGARNRLVLVLFICILFMAIEIGGMFLVKR
jgi:hypothetical protein